MIALLVVLAFPAVFLITGYFLSAPRYTGPASDHFDGKRFNNSAGIAPQTFASFLKWMFTRKRTPWGPLEIIQAEKPPLNVGWGVRITYVNHTTFLIQTDGLNILTDPVWYERASPFAWSGPKRRRPPGVALDDLPPIDLILLSHNHYDHLDVATLQKLYQVHSCKIITALGVDLYLKNKGIANVIATDWWDEISITPTFKIQCVPAQHFSARGMFDRNATLWCGFVVKARSSNLYFAGDTGYNSTTFNEIGTRCAPIHVAIIPIGAYKPEWFMAPVHCSPAEAVKIHEDTKSILSIASHFGTFQLGDESPEEAVADLRFALREKKISDDQFLVLKEGEARFFSSPVARQTPS
jgi:L-ascorbate metabolism protein UlaG (beta-lactamase superfamily)